jgi:hypothetical protein
MSSNHPSRPRVALRLTAFTAITVIFLSLLSTGANAAGFSFIDSIRDILGIPAAETSVLKTSPAETVSMINETTKKTFLDDSGTSLIPTSNGTLDFGTTADGTVATTANTGFSGVRTGSGAGGFTIKNPGQTIGTAGELRGIAPTSGSINSVGIASTEYGTASQVFTTAFEVYFSGGSSGTWYFFAGNGSSFGATQTTAFTGAEIFTGLRFTYGASNAITTANRNSSVFDSTGLSGSPFTQIPPTQFM